MQHGFHNNKQHNCSTSSTQHISILEWFIKDHVTLKTGVMAAENSAFASHAYITFYNILQ